MLFCTHQFLFFFLVVFVAYWLLPRDQLRVVILLAASIAFYAVWNRWLAIIVVASAMMDYLLALGMSETVSLRRRRLLLVTSLAMNFGILFYFKYCNFFLQSLEETLQMLGLQTSLPILSVLLPVGISFYTFEAVNYAVDVYQRRLEGERNPLHFLLFILFFPHLVAGPIVRARQFLPQIARPKHWSWLRANLGNRLILLGLLKKMALADRMPAYVDPVFADPAAFGTAALWLAAIAYALQLYGDFSGYSDIAIGLAHLLGYKLSPNFDLPYLSANMAEFWRRWHMSLSAWIRDYVFIPFGGSRGSSWLVARNLLVTMTLCGLWHGANWNFVVFGFVQGLILVVHRGFRNTCRYMPSASALLQSAPGTVVRVAATFALFCFTLVIFRCATLATAGVMMKRMLSPVEGLPIAIHLHGLWLSIGVVLLCHLVARFKLWQHFFVRLPAPMKGFAYAAALSLTFLLAPDTTKAFIYFQF